MIQFISGSEICITPLNSLAEGKKKKKKKELLLEPKLNACKF